MNWIRLHKTSCGICLQSRNKLSIGETTTKTKSDSDSTGETVARTRIRTCIKVANF